MSNTITKALHDLFLTIELMTENPQNERIIDIDNESGFSYWEAFQVTLKTTIKMTFGMCLWVFMFPLFALIYLTLAAPWMRLICALTFRVKDWNWFQLLFSFVVFNAIAALIAYGIYLGCRPKKSQDVKTSPTRHLDHD